VFETTRLTVRAAELSWVAAVLPGAFLPDRPDRAFAARVRAAADVEVGLRAAVFVAEARLDAVFLVAVFFAPALFVAPALFATPALFVAARFVAVFLAAGLRAAVFFAAFFARPRLAAVRVVRFAAVRVLVRLGAAFRLPPDALAI
jgi:hypothetical protein